MSQYKENLHNIEQIEKKSDSVNDSLDNRFDKFLQQFELSQNTLKEFTKFQSQKEISQLREEIQLSVNITDKEKNYLKDEVSDKDLSSILETAKEIHSEATDHKNSLLEEITQNSELTLLAENKKLLRKIGISDKMMEAAYNPKNAYEHILGWAIGCTATIGNCAVTAYEVTKWLINTPKDIALIMQWKAKYSPKWNI